MPDPELLESSERIPSDRPPINDLVGYHKFKESEYEEGAGRCDICGGGEDAEIHQKPIDHGEQLKRIADALEVLADGAAAVDRIADALERLANLKCAEQAAKGLL